MTFAPAEFEVIQELSGFRLSLFLAVRHEEFLEGVCRLSPAELSKKYKKLKNESNTGRIRKQMIKDGWFTEVVGGIVTKKFNTTANCAVDDSNPESELQVLQDTAIIAVNDEEDTANFAVIEESELQNLQSDTAKIAGTPIANKDLEFKDNLNLGVCEYAPAREGDARAPEDSSTVIAFSPESLGDFRTILFAGICQILEIKRLPNKDDWLEPTLWAHSEGYSSLHGIEVYSLMKKQQWRKGAISPEVWQNNLTNLENLRNEIEEQNGTSIQSHTTGNQNAGRKSNAEIVRKRDYSKFDGVDPTKIFG